MAPNTTADTSVLYTVRENKRVNICAVLTWTTLNLGVAVVARRTGAAHGPAWSGVYHGADCVGSTGLVLLTQVPARSAGLCVVLAYVHGRDSVVVASHQGVQDAAVGGHTVLVHHTGAGVPGLFTAEARVASTTGQALAFRFVVDNTAGSVSGTRVVVGTRLFTFSIDASLKVSAVTITSTLNYLTSALRVSCGAWRALALCLVATADTLSTWWAYVVLQARVSTHMVLAHFGVLAVGVVFTVNC